MWNRKYYVGSSHSNVPDSLGEWTYKKNGKLYKRFKRVYPQYYKYTKRILKHLFKRSISLLPNGQGFQVFQQIAVKKECNLKHLKAIEFRYKVSNKILKTIKDLYPNVQVIDYTLQYREYFNSTK